jgi:hypothetical protein
MDGQRDSKTDRKLYPSLSVSIGLSQVSKVSLRLYRALSGLSWSLSGLSQVSIGLYRSLSVSIGLSQVSIGLSLSLRSPSGSIGLSQASLGLSQASLGLSQVSFSLFRPLLVFLGSLSSLSGLSRSLSVSRYKKNHGLDEKVSEMFSMQMFSMQNV